MPAKGGEVQELIRHVRAAKFKVVKSGNQKHYKVLDARGRPVVDANGPLIISSSPGDMRWREMHVKRLMGAGVLKADPYKETRGTQAEANGNNNGQPPEKKKRGDGHSLTTPEAQAAKLRAIQKKSDANRERTARIRARFEPIAAKLGGWTSGRGMHSSGLQATEVGLVIYSWAKTRGRLELPAKVHTDPLKHIGPEHVAQAVQRLKNPAETLSDRWTPLFEVFVDELQRNAGTPPDPQKAAYRYQELLREAKGISDPPASPAALPPVPVAPPSANGDQEAHVEHVKVGPAHSQQAAPKLALKAMWYMAKGSDDLDDALDVAAEIAELELNNRRGGTE